MKSVRYVKVLVWDLDNTVWDGTLLERNNVRVREGVLKTIETLDGRGILHSVASKNEYEPAMTKLRDLGLDKYFLYPQINWNSKATSIKTIATAIDVGLDAIAFIDDQPFERDEVVDAHPMVLAVCASEVASLVNRPEFMPKVITDESAHRRAMYRADAERRTVERSYQGTSRDFLASLGMCFSIAPADREDLRRAEELTVRTNQLNTTGYTYSYEELDAFRSSSRHLLMIAGLEDRYGRYGKIGLALVERSETVWTLKLLLMSCRVVSRGVGAIFVNYLMGQAKRAGARFLAEFRPNGRNRMMLVTYKFAGFKEVGRVGEVILFEHDLTQIQAPPAYVKLDVTD